MNSNGERSYFDYRFAPLTESHVHGQHPSRLLGPTAAITASGLPTLHVGTGSGGTMSDRRNRNPNWTDGEIVRFLEILQEEHVMKDLLAQRNKQVFCHVAQRLCSEGAEKTWDQCRIKLKNLKSQYRYVKERIPEVASVDLEDEVVLKGLLTVCQTKGISPSSMKHLKYLRRFLTKMGRMRTGGSADLAAHAEDDNSESAHNRGENSLVVDHEESVSPPTTPSHAKDVRLLPSDQDVPDDAYDVESKRPRLDVAAIVEREDLDDGQKVIERFNQDMMEQFLEHQRRAQESLHRWEMEKQRQHNLAMERWRHEAREHEKAMCGLFVQVISECNAALTAMHKAKFRDRTDADEKEQKRKLH